jgi:uncharacterized membrane protein YfcA
MLSAAIKLSAICFLASTAGAISGIGGGIIIKPLLDFLTPLRADEIRFLSGCTVLAMSAVSLLRGKKNVPRGSRRFTLFLVLGAVTGGIAGERLFSHIFALSSGKNSITAAQSCILFVLAAGCFAYTVFKEKIKTHSVHAAMAVICAGLGMGLLSSFLGIGGGPVNIVMLSYFFSSDAKSARVQSLTVIFFSQCAALVLSAASSSIPYIEPRLVAASALCGIAGGFAGSRIVKNLRARQTDYLFMGVLAIVAALSLCNAARM